MSDVSVVNSASAHAADTADPWHKADQLKRLLEDFIVQLQAERDSPPSEALLKASIEQAQLDISRLKKLCDEAKTQAKRRKSELSEWKQWYYSLPGLDKTAELEKLNAEILWRSTEIDALQNQIVSLETKLFNALNIREINANQLTALQAGVYALPVEQDPRLIALQEAYEAALAALPARQE
jgi:hypothetical protein